jgi:hypothetical protein
MSQRLIDENYIVLLLAAYGVHINQRLRDNRFPMTADDWYELNKNKTPQQFADELLKP